MNKLKLIIAREFFTKVKNKTFLLMTVLSPLLMVAMGVLIFFISKSSNEKKRTISYINQSNLFLAEDFENTKTLEFIDVSSTPLEAAKEAVKNTEQYGLLYIPNIDNVDDISKNIQFFSNKSPSVIFTERLEKKLSKRLSLLKMAALNIDTEQVEKSKIKTKMKLSNFDGDKTSKMENSIKLAIGMGAGYIILLFIMIYGTMVMRSVIEEKTSRIIEIIVSSVKPFQLLLGKVIGTAGASFLQITIWGILLSIFYLGILPLLGIDTNAQVTPEQMELMNNATKNVELQMGIGIGVEQLVKIAFPFFLFFIGGYLLYSALYAAIGAAVDNETDTQQFVMIIMMPLVLAMYIGAVVVVNDPHGSIATIFSMIPFTSPIVMLMRIPLGVPIWQIVVSLVLLYLTFLAMIWLAGKIYRVGILMHGKKASFKDLYKWLKY